MLVACSQAEKFVAVGVVRVPTHSISYTKAKRDESQCITCVNPVPYPILAGFCHAMWIYPWLIANLVGIPDTSLMGSIRMTGLNKKYVASIP